MKGHIFELEDYLTRAEEAVVALTGFRTMTDPLAYSAAINCLADVLIEQLGGLREQHRLAWEVFQNTDKPPLKGVEE